MFGQPTDQEHRENVFRFYKIMMFYIKYLFTILIFLKTVLSDNLTSRSSPSQRHK